MKFIKENWQIVLLIALSFITRFAFLNYPSEVVFDEVHFGKFVSSYFTGEYYFDIHPPLGKLLIAGFAKLFGYTPGFDFNHIGEMFDARNLFLLRFLPALFGALLPILIYFILLKLKISPKFALLGGLFAIFDNALLVESKFILVDSMLLFFGFLSIYLYLIYVEKEKLAFLSLAAFFASFALSIKWTGVLFLGIIGLAYIYQCFKKYSLKRAFIGLSILIFLPITIYYLIFCIHLGLLDKSGPGNAYMSGEFVKMSLWHKFFDLNDKMYFYNSTLKATHSFGSMWFQWPYGKRPIWYWAGSKNNSFANIYLFGNIIEWLLIIFGIALSLFIIFVKKMREKLHWFFWFLLIGYFANLFPYATISRVTFLYHYLPSLVFGIIIFCILLEKIAIPYIDELLEKKGKKESIEKANGAIYFGIIAAIIAGFLIISPISYGFSISNQLNNRYSNLLNFFLNSQSN